MTHPGTRTRRSRPDGVPPVVGGLRAQRRPPVSRELRHAALASSAPRTGRRWAIDENGQTHPLVARVGQQVRERDGRRRCTGRSEVSTRGTARPTCTRWCDARRPTSAPSGSTRCRPRRRRTVYQTEAELGQRLSGGCQRQAPLDAAFTWDFAQVGTRRPGVTHPAGPGGAAASVPGPRRLLWITACSSTDEHAAVHHPGPPAPRPRSRPPPRHPPPPTLAPTTTTDPSAANGAELAVARRFADRAEALMASGDVHAIGVAILRRDQMIGEFALGTSSTGAPLTSASPFRTASVSKVLTAIVVLQLAEEGALDLDRPLAEQWTDRFAVTDGQVRLDHGAPVVAAHTSCRSKRDVLRRWRHHLASERPTSRSPPPCSTRPGYCTLQHQRQLRAAGAPHRAGHRHRRRCGDAPPRVPAPGHHGGDGTPTPTPSTRTARSIIVGRRREYLEALGRAGAGRCRRATWHGCSPPWRAAARRPAAPRGR